MVTTGCFSETLTDTLHIGTTAVQDIDQLAGAPRILQQGNGTVTIDLSAAGNYTDLDVYSADGRMVGHYTLSANKATLNLTPGLYIYNATSQNKDAATRGKFVTY